MIAKIGIDSMLGTSFSSAEVTARAGGWEETFDLQCNLASLVFSGNIEDFRIPLNLSGRESGGLVAAAMAAVLRSATLAEK